MRRVRACVRGGTTGLSMMMLGGGGGTSNLTSSNNNQEVSQITDSNLDDDIPF